MEVNLYEPFVHLQKASSQVPPVVEGIQYLKKRVANEDLFTFMDLNSWHRRCVGDKAKLIAGLGWRLERPDGTVIYDSVTDQMEDGERSDVLKFLLVPNDDGDTLEDILQNFLVDYFACGDAYLEIVPTRGGGLGEIYHLGAVGMWRSGKLTEYYQRIEGREAKFSAFDRRKGLVGTEALVYHRLNYDPLSGVYGMPDWYGAVAEMSLHRTITEFNMNMFRNAFMASTAVVVKGSKLSVDGRNAIRNFISNTLTGVSNAGKVLLLESENDRTEISFEKLQMDIQDYLVVDAQLYYRDAIVAADSVPPRLLGIMSSGGLGGKGEIEGQLKIFLNTVLKPGTRMLEGIVRMLLRSLKSEYVFKLNELDLTSLMERVEAAQVVHEIGETALEQVVGL